MPIQPFFSVIIPTYNRGYLISNTLQSVLSQGFNSFEVIIIDDGGTDNTEEIVKRFNSPKVRYFKKENGERGAARNFGWQKARGKYVTFLDSDDIFYLDHLQTAFEKLNELNYPFCLAQAYEIKEDKSGNILLKGYKFSGKLINHEIFKGNFLACFGVFIKSDIFNEVRFEEERKFAGSEDWLLWLQLAARYPFHFNNVVTGALLHHNHRSVLSIEEESLLFRPSFIKQKLQNDEFFLKSFGMKGVNKAFAHVLTYVSLNLAIRKKKRKSFFYLLKAFKAYPGELLQKRALGIGKKILFE